MVVKGGRSWCDVIPLDMGRVLFKEGNKQIRRL